MDAAADRAARCAAGAIRRRSERPREEHPADRAEAAELCDPGQGRRDQLGTRRDPVRGQTGGITSSSPGSRASPTTSRWRCRRARSGSRARSRAKTSSGSRSRTRRARSSGSGLREEGMRLTPKAHPEAGHFYRSDHFSLAKAGVPARVDRGGDSTSSASRRSGGCSRCDDYDGAPLPPAVRRVSSRFRPQRRGAADGHRASLRAPHRQRAGAADVERRRGVPSLARRRSRERTRRGTARAHGERGLARVIGTWGLAAGIVNVTVGGGIFRLPAGVAAALGAGGAARVSRVHARDGAHRALLRRRGEPRVDDGRPVRVRGDGVRAVRRLRRRACCSGSGITLALSAVATFFADSLLALVPALGATGRRVALVVVLVVLAAANVRGVGGVTRFNAFATVAKLLPLVLLVRRRRSSRCAGRISRGTAAPSAARRVARVGAAHLRLPRRRERARAERRGARSGAHRAARDLPRDGGGRACCTSRSSSSRRGCSATRCRTIPTPLASAAAVALGPAGRTMILVGSAVSMFALRERDDARRAAHAVRVRPRRLPARGARARASALAHAVRRDRRAGGDRRRAGALRAASRCSPSRRTSRCCSSTPRAASPRRSCAGATCERGASRSACRAGRSSRGSRSS